MKIALINEDSQAEKNSVIYQMLVLEAEKKGHQVDNYGMFDRDDKHIINYTQIGIIASIIIETKMADFIVTGCGTGQGAMISCNSFSNLVCGYVNTPLDAYLFSQINAGNAISIPFAQNYGWGSELNLNYIFHILFAQEFGGGYPIKYAKEEKESRIRMQQETKFPAQYSVIEALKRMDQHKLAKLLKYEKFENLFDKYAKECQLTSYIKRLILK